MRQKQTPGALTMNSTPSQELPYLDWCLDRWKIAVIFFLFSLLLFAALLGWDTKSDGKDSDFCSSGGNCAIVFKVK
jgi:hypothetical protein